jgi:soluble lytic murein transglycosylase-like protein
MNLSFYESLSEDQKGLANKIAQRAKALGIPPELAVSVAYQESGLNPSVGQGSVGEIGLMQVRPETGRELGFTPKDLRDLDKNIDAGLAYLKKSLDLSGGDTRLAAAGYNAGVNHPFFSKDTAKLPDTTVWGVCNPTG